MIYFTDSFHLISLIMNVTVGLTLRCKKYKYLIITGRSAENVVLMMRLGMTITAGLPRLWWVTSTLLINLPWPVLWPVTSLPLPNSITRGGQAVYVGLTSHRSWQTLLTQRLFTDVRQTLCGREPGPPCSHLQAAQGEDPGHHRLLHPPVPGVLGEVQEEDPNLSQVLQTYQEVQGTGRTGYQQREYIIILLLIIN